MTGPTSGGLSSGDEPTSRRLPLHTPASTDSHRTTATDPWDPEPGRDEANPFAGSTTRGTRSTTLGALSDSGSPTGPLGGSALDGPPDLDEEPGPTRRARTSLPVVLGLICSLIAGCAALTAWFAPVVVALGGLGVLLSILGLFTARRRHVSGRLVAVLAILIGLAAVGLGVADHLGTFSWLNHDLPEHARQWLNSRVPFLG